MAPDDDPSDAPPGLVRYTAADGSIRLQVRVDEKTLWLTQSQMASIFQTTEQNIGLRILVSEHRFASIRIEITPHRAGERSVNGSSQRTPVVATSRTFRVTRVRSCTNAVAARRPSTVGTGSGTFSSPHRLATAVSMGSRRSPNRSTSDSSHCASPSAAARSRRRIDSTPRRSSPATSTLVNRSRSTASSNQRRTPVSARGPFRSSDRTLVSSSQVTTGSSWACRAGGRSRRRRRHRASSRGTT